MGGIGDGAAEEDGSWDLNPGAAAKERDREDHAVLGEKGEDHAALVKLVERTTQFWGAPFCHAA